MTEPKRFQPNSIALTIAGSDPSGGAGIQADLKTFQQIGVYGASVVTLLTAQNTMGVRRVETMPPDLVIDQIDAVLDDLKPVAAKTGALGNADIIEAFTERAERFTFPLIVDPVMVSKHGDKLVSDDAIEAYRGLMKHAFLVTPNRYELAALTGNDLNSTESIAKAIHDLHVMGAKFVLAKMGEVDGSSEHILGSGQENLAIQSSRFPTKNTHGAGCVLSAMITGLIAYGETDLRKIINRAIRQVTIGIYNAQSLGRGQSPVETRVLENDPAELERDGIES